VTLVLLVLGRPVSVVPHPALVRHPVFLTAPAELEDTLSTMLLLTNLPSMVLGAPTPHSRQIGWIHE